LGKNNVFGEGGLYNGGIVPEIGGWKTSLFYDYVCNDRKAGTYATNRAIGSYKEADGFQYIETRYGAFLNGYFGSSGNRLVIPATLAKLPVKAIGWLQNYGISRVQIPDSVTYIGDRAFASCQLTTVTIPNSVTYIGNDAFTGKDGSFSKGENQLTSVTIGNSVLYIGDGAFSNNQLTSVTIPNSVTYIGSDAFGGNQLTSVTIPNSVTHIGSGTFSNNKLTTVTIPNSVTHIGGGAFSNNKLTTVTIPNSVTHIGDNAFSGNQLTSVTIGNNVNLDRAFGSGFEGAYDRGGKAEGTYQRDSTNSSIWGMANGEFQYTGSAIVRYNGSGGAITIPSTINGRPVTAIGEKAFSGKQLTSVVIPDSVTSIGSNAFDNSLTSVTIGNNVAVESSSFGSGFKDAYDRSGKAAGTYHLETYRNYSTNRSIWGMKSGDFLYIGSAIIRYTGSDHVVTIPSDINGTPVTSIGEEAFFGKQLTSVTIPDSVTSIGGNAFVGAHEGNFSLTSVTIGSNVTLVNSAFMYNFADVYNACGKAAGTYQYGETMIEESSGWKIKSGDFLCGGSASRNNYTRVYDVFAIVGYTGSGGAVTIPSAINGKPVTAIEDGAFSGKQLTSVTIPDSVTRIGGAAFDGNFSKVYNGAGTYTRRNARSDWKKQK